MTILETQLVAIGAWGAGFQNWDELKGLLAGKAGNDAMPASPKPEIIPANERRRAPLPVKLAIESSWQATQQAGIDPKALSCVFVSGLGDTQLTDYMCKVLAGDDKQLSPTKFHNSVHNAAAGYWTISTGCTCAANSVAGYHESVSLTLLEGMTQCQLEQQPILLTFFDAPVSQVLKSLLKNDMPFSVSMIIAPMQSDYAGTKLTAEVVQEQVQWPEINSQNQVLQQVYENNPVARILPILEKAQDQSNHAIRLPLSQATALQLQLG